MREERSTRPPSVPYLRISDVSHTHTHTHAHVCGATEAAKTEDEGQSVDNLSPIICCRFTVDCVKTAPNLAVDVVITL